MSEIQTPNPSLSSLFGQYTNQLVTVMDGVSKIAEKGAWVFMLTLGALLLIVPIAAKLSAIGTDLKTTEFISVIAAGLVLVLGGAFLRFYHVSFNQGATRDLVNKLLDIAAKNQQTAGGIIKDLISDKGP